MYDDSLQNLVTPRGRRGCGMEQHWLDDYVSVIGESVTVCLYETMF